MALWLSEPGLQHRRASLNSVEHESCQTRCVYLTY
jgi:hypothetical protein